MSASSSPAPWRSLFLEHISTMPTPEFTLATLHQETSPSVPKAPGPPSASPRARTCVFRGMFASLPVNPKNTAPLNPPVYESDLLSFTTDARMHKVPDLFGSATPNSGTLGSGGGAPVEAVFWPRDTSTQWRLRGTAWILTPDLDVAEADTGTAQVRELILSHLRRRTREESTRAPVPEEQQGQVTGDGGGGWTFAREITAQFGNLSPLMRGLFKNPPPGTPKKPEDGDGALGRQVDDLDDAEARANFRVVVIVPAEVDQTDLSDPKEPRRWIYRRSSRDSASLEDGAPGETGWEKIEVWP